MSIFDDSSAFDPMYDDHVIIRAPRGSASLDTTVDACVLSAADGDPLSAESIDADREDIAIAVRDDDWRFFSRLRVGDRIFWNSREYAFVSARRDAAIGWIVRARATGGAA